MRDRRDTLSEPDSLFRAIRFALAALTLGLAYINIRVSMAIPLFRQIFADMLEGQALPLTTTMILQARHVLLFASWLVPVAAIWAIFMPLKPRSFYLIGIASLLIIVQSIVVCTGLSQPLFHLVHQMGDASPQNAR
jgi:hypothetical protein